MCSRVITMRRARRSRFSSMVPARRRNAAPESNPAVEVLFSCAGQTADDMIERAAHRFSDYGEVLAVTDDVAERDTVTGLGGLASSCANFIRTLKMRWRNCRMNCKITIVRNGTVLNRSHQRDFEMKTPMPQNQIVHRRSFSRCCSPEFFWFRRCGRNRRRRM